MYRNAELRRYQYYVTPDWPGRSDCRYSRPLLRLFFASRSTIITNSGCPGASQAAFTAVRAWPGRGAAYPDFSLSCRTDDVGPRRPGALIAGTWAAMQYMGQECVHKFMSH